MEAHLQWALNMKLIIKNTAAEVADYASDMVIKLVSDKPNCTLGLPTGETPKAMYLELIKAHKINNLDFSQVRTFNMDEYVGINPNDMDSYHYFMQDNLFKHININRNNTHMLNGLAENLEAECINYEAKIAQNGGIDLFIGGVGVNGHIAFNEMFSSLSSRTRCVKLANSTRSHNARFFNGKLDNVPTHAVTVGIQTILDAKKVIIMAVGVMKANAIRDAIDGYITHRSAITSLQAHPDAIIVCDVEASSLLSKEALARAS